MAFGMAIKKLREDARISVEKLAGRIGVSADRWRKWEEKDFDPRDEDQALIESFFGLSLKHIERLSSIKDFLKGPSQLPETSKAEVEPTTMQILAALAEAFKNQAEALRTQAEIMKIIEKNMARADSQARSELSLTDIRKDVTTLVERQELAIEEFRERFLEIREGAKGPSKGVHKTRSRNDGNG